jgi:hypothetical protein
MQKSGIRNAIASRLSNSQKSNVATEPSHPLPFPVAHFAASWYSLREPYRLGMASTPRLGESDRMPQQSTPCVAPLTPRHADLVALLDCRATVPAHRALLEAFLADIPLSPSACLLDVGSGTGSIRASAFSN